MSSKNFKDQNDKDVQKALSTGKELPENTHINFYMNSEPGEPEVVPVDERNLLNEGGPSGHIDPDNVDASLNDQPVKNKQ